MSLQEQINGLWKEAMKSRDPKKDVLALIRNELKNKAIEVRSAGDSSTVISDEQALVVLTKMAKQRRESIAQFEAGGRDDLASKEKLELSVIESYLPQKISMDELRNLVLAQIKKSNATSVKEMGKIMGPVMAQVQGRCEGAEVQAMVKELLS